MEDRAGVLARNFWIKIIVSYENKEMISSMNRLNQLDGQQRFVNPTGSINVFLESWRDVKKLIKDTEIIENRGIFDSTYESQTNFINIELDIGEKRKVENISNYELINMYKTKYELTKDCKIIYTDGSKKEDNSVGIGRVVEDQEIAYTASINKNSSIFTAEAMAIKMALGSMIDLQENKDLLILTDSQSVCKKIKSNKIERNKNKNIVTIRERIELYINTIKGNTIKGKLSGKGSNRIDTRT